ncbi:MAG TPA: FHA domain-containing protein, partial [Polyangiales bacterium]|nr:FHA domain-containing protein [Polyangiales bacterium]
MARFFLRYQAIDLKLDVSEFVVGRTPGCHLVLGDALVSRRHAAFRVVNDTVEVRDLGSRNGVLVNGARIEGPALLKDGDQVRIGAQDLVVSSAERDPREGGTEELMQCRNCGELYDAMSDVCTACGHRDKGGPIGPDGQVPDTVVVSEPEQRTGSGTAQSGGSLEVLARLADKALGMGRYDEGERLVGSMMNGILSRATGSEGQARETLSLASRYALRLAEVTHSPIWIDDTFRLYSTA